MPAPLSDGPICPPPRPGARPERLLCAEAPDLARARLEAFVVERYAQAYGAQIRHFLPVLLGLEGADGRLLGVVGTTPGTTSGTTPGTTPDTTPDTTNAGPPWFCEQYLDAPVEQQLAAALGRPVARRQLAEVGNLAGEPTGAGRLLLGSLAAWLDGAGRDWAIFTATRPLRILFRRLAIELVDLGAAEAARLGAGAADWGRYYRTDPHVVAARIRDVRAACGAAVWPVAAHAWLDGAGWAGAECAA